MACCQDKQRPAGEKHLHVDLAEFDQQLFEVFGEQDELSLEVSVEREVSNQEQHAEVDFGRNKVDGRVAQHRLVQRGEVLAQRHDDGYKLVGRVCAPAERARLGHVADIMVEKVLWRRFPWVDARLGNGGSPELVMDADGTVWRHLQQIVRQPHVGEVGIDKMVACRLCPAGMDLSTQL
ncbi:hypothetical protein OGATHE_002250 [Ogataea polymorpha]|uniref:Uncharacterized protein n=1 Tax=Ogataea polymorpha TaxID=460523 RepID=A0A9P8TBN9_9ASCO|nr:hypothetical protein OGATHE_002250 [Ogataea polymorpha]